MQNGQSILLREHDVQQDQGGLLPLHGLPKIRRTLETFGFIPLAAQGIDHQLADAVVVLQQIDSFHSDYLSFSRP